MWIEDDFKLEILVRLGRLKKCIILSRNSSEFPYKFGQIWLKMGWNTKNNYLMKLEKPHFIVFPVFEPVIIQQCYETFQIENSK